MINSPLTSIIVLTFNSQEYIRQTLDSLIQQKTTFPFEIIIVDDESKDNTIAILNEYQKSHDNIKVFFNEINAGIITSYKYAIDQCSGKYFAYCGHDDFWQDDLKLQIQVEFLENNPEFGLVHTEYNILDEKTGCQIKRYIDFSQPKKINQGEISDELINSYYIGSCTPCYRKNIFEKYVPINDFIRIQLPFEDIPVNISISFHTKIGFIDRSMATLRFGHKSTSNPSDIKKCEKYLEGHKTMIDYFYEKYPDKYSKKKNNFKIFKTARMLQCAFESNNFEKAKYYALQLQQYDQKSNQILCANYFFLFRLYLFIRRNPVLFEFYIMLLRIKVRFKRP